VRETSEEEREREEKNAQVAVSVWESTEMLMDVLFTSFLKVPPALRCVAYDMKVCLEFVFLVVYVILKQNRLLLSQNLWIIIWFLPVFSFFVLLLLLWPPPTRLPWNA
jgi:hypothetical protein